ncbi:hypothetical protein ACD591_04355 [Rufibacter glacialis]|uniref:Uncharacterized protein n=1 Tax=Rufibacter glacialis TaxID=1259555 RepID=A0A5M8QF02_9BACT|nr:hypothetical protein [Rufibacter glacialis]KAA6434589.1 hypothetical protein FOE74_10415 [Rufibacter glacialis]
MHRETDEIDLREVFQKLGSLLKSIWAGITGTFYMLLRRWPLVVLVTLLGIGVSYLWHQSKRPYYMSSLTLAPSALRNEFFADQVHRLSLLVADGNWNVVASDLQLTPEEATNIKSVKYISIDHVRTPEDSVMVGSPFKVDVELYDNKFFAPLQGALLGYFKNNPYFAKSTQTKREQLQATVAKLKQDIASIDSIKQVAVALKGPTNGFVYGEPLDPTNLYKQSAALFETQAAMEAELKELETVQVVVGFAPLVHPSGPRLKIHLLSGAIAGFVLAVLAAFWAESRKNKRLLRGA